MLQFQVKKMILKTVFLKQFNMPKLWIVKCKYTMHCEISTNLINSHSNIFNLYVVNIFFLNRIHIMSGTVVSPTIDNDTVYEKNLLHAIEKCQQEDIVVVIEPINNYSVPNYYMNNFRKGDIILEGEIYLILKEPTLLPWI